MGNYLIPALFISTGRLPTTPSSAVVQMLAVKGNKKIIQQNVMKQTNKTHTLKDFHNIAQSMKPKDNSLQALLNEMMKDNDATAEDGTLKDRHNKGLSVLPGTAPD
jgi:hypothetical protein